MSIISKYAVPFVTKKSRTAGNVLTKELESKSGLVGKLVIVLPTSGLGKGNSTGIRLSIYSETDDQLFTGIISGNSDDGYSWMNVSSQSTQSIKLADPIPTLFCECKVESKTEYTLRSIQLGNDPEDGESGTNWGTKIKLIIEVLQTTDDINRYFSSWQVSIGTSHTWDIVSEVVSVPQSAQIVLQGAVRGFGNLSDPIQTTFEDNNIKELAEGRLGEGISLLGNASLSSECTSRYTQGLSEELVIMKSSPEIRLNYTTDKEGTREVGELSVLDLKGKTYDYKLSVGQINLGTWSETSDDSTRWITQRVTTSTNPMSYHLESGELAVVDGGINSDVFYGSSTGTRLVGAVKIVTSDNEVSRIPGRLIYNTGEDRLKVLNGSSWTNLGVNKSDLTLDNISNTDNWRKTRASMTDANGVQLSIIDADGYISIIGSKSTAYVKSSDVAHHVTETDPLYNQIHLDKEGVERAKIAKIPAGTEQLITESELNKRLAELSEGIVFSYFDSINEISYEVPVKSDYSDKSEGYRIGYNKYIYELDSSESSGFKVTELAPGNVVLCLNSTMDLPPVQYYNTGSGFLPLNSEYYPVIEDFSIKRISTDGTTTDDTILSLGSSVLNLGNASRQLNLDSKAVPKFKSNNLAAFSSSSTGLKQDSSTGVISHSNSITAQSTEALYKLTFDSTGHITKATSVDIEARLSAIESALGGTTNIANKTLKVDGTVSASGGFFEQ